MFVVRRCGFHPQICPSRRVLASWCPALLGPFLLLRFSVRSRSDSDCPVSCACSPGFHVSCVKPVVRAPTRPPLPPPSIDKEASIYRVRKLLDVRPRGVVTSFGGLEGYGPEERRWIPAGTSWIARWSRTSTVLVRLLSLERLVALVERGVLSWSGFCLFSLSLTLCCTRTHTHTRTCILTHTSLSPSPVCHFNQRSRCFAVPPVLTHLISPSIYRRLRSRLSAGLLYVMHSCVLFPS